MKVSFFKYVHDYYKSTNKDLPVECSSKYSVDQRNRLITIILGYSFIFVSWTIFLIDSTISFMKEKKSKFKLSKIPPNHKMSIISMSPGIIS